MAKEKKCTKSEVLAAYENEQRRLISEKIIAKRYTSCFKCSKANPTEVIYDQTEMRQYMNDKILYVHDQVFNCEILKNKKKNFLQNCLNGDKQAPHKCSTCAHANHPLTVKYINLTITRQNISEMRTVYKCMKKYEKGHYYRSVFSCDDYKEK